MSNSGQQKTQVSKEALLRIFNGILSHVEKTNEDAREQLERLEVLETDEFAIQLVQCVVDTTSSEAIAELASVTLKKYVENHWSSSSTVFKPPKIGAGGKARIKQGLLVGLRTSNSKVRHEVADAISVIVQSNWPQNWTDIVETLVQYLNDKSESARLGSMLAFTEVTRHLTETQLADVGPTILEEMYRIWDNEEQPMSIRRGAIKIFTQMVTSIPARQRPEVAHQHLNLPIAMFCTKFLDTLKIRNGATIETQMKILIVDTIRVITERSPKCIATLLPKITPLIWDILMDCAEVHQGSALNVREEEKPEDLADLVLAIFKFIGVVIDSTYKYAHNRSCLDIQDDQWFYLQETLTLETLHHLIMLVEMTDRQIQLWTQNFNKFVEEEKATDRSRNPCSVRGKAQEAFVKILGRPERIAENSNRLMNALFDIILKLIEEGNTMKTSRKSGERKNWWKLHEASIQMFGMMKDLILEKQSVGKLSFDIAAFLQNVVLTDLSDAEIHPLLVGRCLYIGGVYALEMPKELRFRFVEATINGLKTQSACARILAAKAAIFWLHVATTEGNDQGNGKLVKTYVPALGVGLINLGNQLMSLEVLMIVLTNFAVLIPLDKAFASSVESGIYGLTFAAFINFPDEYRISKICKTVFGQLAQNPDCIGPLVSALVPALVGKLAVTPSGKCDHGKIQADALDVLKHLVENSPLPLNSLLTESAFPASCHFILNTLNSSILIKGSELIRAFLKVAPRQVLGYRDINGHTGSQCVVRIAAHLFTLESSLSSCGSSSLYVFHSSKVLLRTAIDIATLLVKDHSLHENIDPLLEGVLVMIDESSRCGCQLDIPQRLFMVFVYIFKTSFDTVFNFLSTTQKLEGQNALAFVVSDGFCKQLKKFKRQDRKLVTLILSKILEHSMMHSDSPIHKMMIEERTGSKPSTSVPLLFTISRIITDEITKHVDNCKEDTDACKEQVED